MGRTKQTARKSSGGKAPRKQLAAASSGKFRTYMTSMQASGSSNKNKKVVFINSDNTLSDFGYAVPEPSKGSMLEPVPTAMRTAPVPELGVAAEQSWLGLTFASIFNGQEGMAKHGRPALALTIVLDNSGSMMSTFPDSTGTSAWLSKLALAKQCVRAMLKQLRPGDSLSIMTFNHSQDIILAPTLVAKVDMEELEMSIAAIQPNGGTNISDGLNLGISQTRECVALAQETANAAPAGSAFKGVTLRRTVLLTDMQSSQHDQDMAHAAMKAAAGAKDDDDDDDAAWTHTTVVGVGVDLSRASVNRIVAIPGCAYMSVASAEDFVANVTSEFAFDIMPLAFDITITCLDGSFIFNKGYGSSELALLRAGSKTATLSCEFPSPRQEDGSIKGALRLFRITSASSVSTVNFRVRWRDFCGNKHHKDMSVQLPAPAATTTTPPAVASLRKGIAVVRYLEVLEAYCLAEAAPAAATAAPRQEMAGHAKWLQTFEALRAWLKAECNAVKEHSVYSAGGSNQSIRDTIEQVIALESKETKQLQSTIKVTAYRAKLRRSKRMHAPPIPRKRSAVATAARGGGGATVPTAYECPITQDVMQDPVIAADGHTYERSAMEVWLKEHALSPMTGLPLPNKTLIPNRSLKACIEEYVAAQQSSTAASGGGAGGGAGAGASPPCGTRARSKRSTPTAAAATSGPTKRRRG